MWAIQDLNRNLIRGKKMLKKIFLMGFLVLIISTNIFAQAPPKVKAASVTPSDTVNLTNSGILYVGVTGDVKVITTEGSTVTFKNVPVGWFEHVRVKRVFSNGTSASEIIVAY